MTFLDSHQKNVLMYYYDIHAIYLKVLLLLLFHRGDIFITNSHPTASPIMYIQPKDDHFTVTKYQSIISSHPSQHLES